MSYRIIRRDITTFRADAIVNPLPQMGSDVDTAIARAAGPELPPARRIIGSIVPGCAAVTPAFRLPARFLIHVVVPLWQGREAEDAEALAICCRCCLRLAVDHGCRSVAFPLLSGGNRGFPPEPAIRAVTEIFREFLAEQDLDITLVVPEGTGFRLNQVLCDSVESYILQAAAREIPEERYSVESSAPRQMPLPTACVSDRLPRCLSPREEDLMTLLSHTDEGFSQTLMALIDRSGKKDSEIYRKANIDRKLFSKIRNNPHYQPSKPTALAFAIALELDLDETADFIRRAGFALSHSSRFDLILEYFILRGEYDLYTINETLFAFDQPLLGG